MKREERREKSVTIYCIYSLLWFCTIYESRPVLSNRLLHRLGIGVVYTVGENLLQLIAGIGAGFITLQDFDRYTRESPDIEEFEKDFLDAQSLDSLESSSSSSLMDGALFPQLIFSHALFHTQTHTHTLFPFFPFSLFLSLSLSLFFSLFLPTPSHPPPSPLSYNHTHIHSHTLVHSFSYLSACP